MRNEVMLHRRDTRLCFCKDPSESIHHSCLLYFIVRLNTSPHGKLGAEISMEKMSGSQQEKKKGKTYQIRSSLRCCSGYLFFLNLLFGKKKKE